MSRTSYVDNSPQIPSWSNSWALTLRLMHCQCCILPQKWQTIEVGHQPQRTGNVRYLGGTLFHHQDSRISWKSLRERFLHCWWVRHNPQIEHERNWIVVPDTLLRAGNWSPNSKQRRVFLDLPLIWINFLWIIGYDTEERNHVWVGNNMECNRWIALPRSID